MVSVGVRIGVLTILLSAPGISRPAVAQETVNYGSISGRVVDPAGAVVRDARVRARQTQTNVMTEARTDQDGRFRFSYLRVGPYEIVVNVAGFADSTRMVTVTVGSAFDLPIALAVAGVETSVTVAGDSAVIETARTQIASTVAQAEVQALPMNGRNFLDLALLVPGVSPTNVGGGTQLFAETSAVPGVGLSVGSQRNFSNNFVVDGLSANDDAAGLSGIAYGVDAIDQFQVVTSGGQAELGRALGGYVSIVTKSGTNTPAGDVYDYQRDRSLNARNALTGTALPMRQTQFGGSFGGAIAPSRTFFFGNAEHRRLRQSGVVTIADSTVAAINARLAATGYRGPGVATGIYANPVDTTQALAKVDHHVSERHQLTVRFSQYNVSSSNAARVGGTSAPSAATDLTNADRTIAFGHVAVLTPRLVNETRAQFAFSDLEAPPADLVGPAVSIQGVALFGTQSGAPTARTNRLFQVVDNVTLQAGAHAVRFGVDALYNDLSITFPRQFRGSYGFSSLATFLTGAYNNAGFTQTFGVSEAAQTNPNLGLYVQDEWKAGSRLTINAGVRYDLQWLETVALDRDNISPRVGLVWTPSASRRTVVRGNFGLFYDRVPLRAVANALLSANNTTDLNSLQQISVSLSPAQSTAPVFPNILSAVVPSVTLVNFTTIDRHLRNAYSRQASLELEHQLGAATTVSVGYQHVGGHDLIMQINQNVPACAASGGNNGCRPNPAYANNNQYSSVGSSEYNGLHLSLVQRAGRWAQYRVSYTFSKAMNNVGEAFFNSPIDPFDLSKDWARSDDDQRHRLVVSASVQARGFQASLMLQQYSPLPFNITTGTNTIQGTAARPALNGAFISRNAGDGSPFSTANVRVSRRFALSPRASIEGLVEVFNLFNRRNDVARITVFGTGAYPTAPASNFGQVTVVGDPRTAQLGIRVRF